MSINSHGEFGKCFTNFKLQRWGDREIHVVSVYHTLSTTAIDLKKKQCGDQVLNAHVL